MSNKIHPMRYSKDNIAISNELQINKSQQLDTKSQPKQTRLFAETDQLSRLEKYEDLDSKDLENKQFFAYQGFKGPRPYRTMTDKKWLFIFFVIYVLFSFFAAIGIQQGTSLRLQGGLDFRAEICGVGGLRHRPYLYYANALIDDNVAWCVQQCPPHSGGQICMYDTDHTTITPFCYSQMQSEKLGRYCIPKEPSNRDVVLQALNSPHQALRRVATDLYLSWDVIILCSFLCIFMSYLCSVSFNYQCMIGVITWVGVVGTALFLFIFAYLFQLEAQRIRDFQCIPGSSPSSCGGVREQLLKGLSIILIIAATLYLLLVVCTYKQIKRGIDLLRHEYQIIKALSQLRWFSFLIAFLGMIVACLMFIVLINAMTVGDKEMIRAKNIDGNRVWKVIPNVMMQNMNAFSLFIFLFSLVLMLVINDMFISYALSVWFFTKQKDSVKIPGWFVIKMIFRYHFGTCVLISFNLFFLQAPKLLIRYLRNILRYLPQNSSYVRYTQACCMCNLHIYETYLRYVSLHSIVQVAVWSEDYYSCSRKAYFLLSRNQNKVKDIDQLQSFVVFQLQIFLSLLGSLPTYLMISYLKTTPIEMPLVPTLFMFILSIFYTSAFQGSYDITSKAVIQLYLMDGEMFIGEQRFTEPFIQEFMEFVQNQKEEINLVDKFFGDNNIFQSDSESISQYYSEEEEEDEDENIDNFDDEENMKFRKSSKVEKQVNKVLQNIIQKNETIANQTVIGLVDMDQSIVVNNNQTALDKFRALRANEKVANKPTNQGSKNQNNSNLNESQRKDQK